LFAITPPRAVVVAGPERWRQRVAASGQVIKEGQRLAHPPSFPLPFCCSVALGPPRLSEHLRKRRATVERRKASVRDRAGKCPSLLALGARRRGAGQTGGAGGGGGGGGGNKAKEEQLGSRAVRVAIAGNSAILIAKLGAYAYR